VQYLCLVYAEEKNLTPALESETRLTPRSIAYNKEMMRSGHYVISAALQSIKTATTVRSRGSDTSVTDGPFAETKEQLCGFVLLEARDLNDAIRVASRIPMAQVGCIEIRPVMRLEEQE
jgi:hypothetical protein